TKEDDLRDYDPFPLKVARVLCHGCFDLLHLGHIRHLQEARKLGDWLTVSVTADEFVGKGPGRPHFSAEHRAEALEALDCVDEVFINHSGDAVAAINRFRPNIYVKGIDYEQAANDFALARERAAVEKHGGKFATTKSQKWSSSRLLNAETY